MNTPRAFLTSAIAALIIMINAPFAQAEDPIATELATADAKEWIGLWKINTVIMDRDFELFLNIADVEGQLGATLDMERNPEPRAFSTMSKTEEGIEMEGELLFMGSLKVEVHMALKFDAPQEIVGIVKNPGGFFESPLTGGPLTQEELDSVQGARRAPTETQIRVSGEKAIRLTFSDLEMTSTDREIFENLKDGDIFEYTLHRAHKLYTDFDLKQGDVIIEEGNMAENYPGVYSVWMRKTADGFNLVFNNQPDIWGSRHLPEHDKYEVPLTHSKVDGDPSETFKAEFQQDGNMANLSLFWGDDKWTSTFEIVQ